jgi:hypothetical protein
MNCIAALLIQGSAQIFSKKVEMLYNLVYDVLNFMKTKKASVEANSNNRRKSNLKVNIQKGDVEMDFVALDDLMEEEEDAQIELPADLNQVVPSAKRRSQHFKASVNLFLNYDLPSNLSYEDSTKNQTTNFKLSSCVAHESGTLLLQEGDQILIESVRSLRTARPQSLLTPNSKTRQTLDVHTPPAVITDIQQQEPENNGMDDNDGFGGGGGFDDDNDYYNNMNDHRENPIVPDMPQMEDLILSEKNLIAQIGGTTTTASTNNQQSPSHYNSFHLAANQSSNLSNFFQPLDDVWEPLDPHSEDKTSKKPFKLSKLLSQILDLILTLYSYRKRF